MKYATIIIFFFYCLFGCNTPPSQPRITAETRKLDTFLSDLIDRQNIPGLTVAATRNDSIVYSGAFGFRNLDTKEPMTTSNIFHWASVSKTFVATAIMQLIEKGKLDLDEKVTTYVPYFKQSGDKYKSITLRQMLNHTSGIGDVDDYEWDKPQNDEAAPERFVRGLENDSLLFAPGENWKYSNTAFEILGVVISRVSGVPFETYVKQNILKPLGMQHSSFVYPEIPDSLRTTGHVWAAKPIVSKVYPYNRIHAPSSTMNSNVLEMTHYAMANLHRGEYNGVRILADSTYNLLWTNSVNMKDKPAIGVSWFLDEHRGLKTAAHGGSDTGFKSYLLLVPEKNISVMLACNYELCQSRDVALAVLDLLLGEKPTDVKTQIGFPFAEILISEGIDKAKEFYTRTKADTSLQRFYYWSEDDAAMVYPGFLLFDNKLNDEAFELFKFNLELNPNSGYARGYLGVAYATKGDKDLARLNLKKAIEMVPSEQYFKNQLKLVEKKGTVQ